MNRQLTGRPHWLIQHQADLPAHNRWLCGSEATVFAGFRFAKRRQDWRLGRWTAKQAVGAYLAAQDAAAPGAGHFIAEPEIVAAADGAPEAFVAGRALPLTISLSHCQDVGLCAVAARPQRLGCDIEAIERRHDRFIDDYFTESEQLWVRGLPEQLQPLAATLVWSAKESALKALRTGLRRDTRSIAVARVCDPTPPSSWSPLSLHDRDGDLQLDGWWRLHGSFVVTVVGVDLVDRPRPSTTKSPPSRDVGRGVTSKTCRG